MFKAVMGACSKAACVAILVVLALGCAEGDMESELGERNDAQGACVEPSVFEQRHGVNVHRLPSGIEQAKRQQYKDQLVGMEARWIRALYWNPTGGINRQQLKEDLAWARENGMRVLLTFDVNAVPGWRSTSPGYHASDQQWQAYSQAFNDELSLALEELGGVVDAWQILNEPNQQGGQVEFQGFMHPKRFGQVTVAAADLIHATLPDATVVSAGLVNWRTGNRNHDVNGPAYMERVVAHVGRLPVDVLAFHAYGTLPPDDGGPAHGDHFALDKLQTRFEEQANDWRPWRDRVSSLGQVKLWVTEFGGPLDVGRLADEPKTEAYRTAALNIGFRVWQNKGVERAFFFAMTDFAGHPGENLGLLTRDLRPRDAYTAFDSLTPETRACSLEEIDTTEGGDTTGDGTCAWNCGDGTVCRQQRCVPAGEVLDGCSSDSDCNAGECVNGSCRSVDPPMVTDDGTCAWECGGGTVCRQQRCVSVDEAIEGCSSDNDCASDEACVSGQCQARQTGDLVDDGTCAWNCGEGTVCQQQRCVAANSGGGDDVCTSDSDCGSNESCVGGQCQARQTGGLVDDGTCAWNCGEGTVCQQQRCVAANNGGGDDNACFSDNDCNANESCVSGQCQARQSGGDGTCSWQCGEGTVCRQQRCVAP